MSKIIGRPLYAPAPAGGGGKPSAPKFTYDGDYVIRDDGVVELLTNGTLVFIDPAVIDVFLVGGGGAGGYGISGYSDAAGGFGGGGSGYTKTVRRISVNGSYDITIGKGGAIKTSVNGAGGSGGATTFGSVASVNGGQGAANGRGSASSSQATTGAAGGSGGGGGVVMRSDYGAGGSDGNNGESGYKNGGEIAGGTGQGTTTREFGENGGKLYAGGGGGGRHDGYREATISLGGDGGGGNGAWSGARSSQAATNGADNTGGGGGGGTFTTGYVENPGAGGSGIVCFRDAHELPELAGTWVLNERMYAPESYFTENVRFTGVKTGTQGSVTFIAVQFYYATGTKKSLLRFSISNSNIQEIYNFTENTWTNKYQTITFPAGATASDEFRAWLASNATKQTA